jgi:hypothetical protein
MSGVSRRQLAPGAVSAYRLSDYLRKRRYFYERFATAQPIVATVASTITALPTASQGLVCSVLTPRGNYMEWFQTTAQTLHPVGHASGLVISGDLVNNECNEFVPGGNDLNSALGFVVGTDNFFAKATLEITDVSGSDQLLVGFRKPQTYGVPTSFLTTGDGIYTDFVGIGFAATAANPNPVNVSSDLNNSGSALVQSTGFTWADTTIHSLEVQCIGRSARFLINGVPLGGSVAFNALGAAITAQATKTAAYTFDSGDTMIPFIFVRHDASTPGAVYLRELEIGALIEADKDPSAR